MKNELLKASSPTTPGRHTKHLRYPPRVGGPDLPDEEWVRQLERRDAEFWKRRFFTKLLFWTVLIGVLILAGEAWLILAR